MGSCLSKKSVCASSSSSSPVEIQKPPEKLQSDSQLEKKEAVVKKEIFVIKHRISHEIERPRSDDENGDSKNVEGKIGEGLDVGAVGNGGGGGGGAAPVRTSSCTKEEVDAILIQCGRLSRSSSTGKAGHLSSENGGRKYSGSKRSYDFDHDNGRSDGNNVVEGDDDAVARERENRRRERHRQSQGRRRTPSREREKDQAAQQQRSGSRERVAGGGSGGGRRVSRSPGRRSESPITANSNSSSANTNSRPGKMVSVPATVSSMAMDKSTNAGGGGEPNSGAAIKRIQVKRNVGGDGAAVGTTRTASSPRARSPANVRVLNENSNQNQPISLSRSNSRKAEHSPYRRNPLGEIDTNIISSQAAPIQKTNGDKHIVQGAENRINQQQHLVTEETKGQYGISGHVGLNVISSVGPGDNPKLNAVARTRSSRLSRELDINPETLSNPNAPPSSSYTALLLEDIQNFHQKNTTPSPPPPSFSLPQCLTKACSILEAVADLNSSTGENKPSLAVRKTVKTDPTILESEVVVNDDLMEPSFHKYVTVKRGGTIGVGEHDEDFEEQESSGSNSVVVGSQQQQWLSSSGWEPNSAESTDRWTCSSAASASASSSGKRVVSAKKRNSQHSGIGRGRIGTGGGSTLQDNVVFRV